MDDKLIALNEMHQIIIAFEELISETRVGLEDFHMDDKFIEQGTPGTPSAPTDGQSHISVHPSKRAKGKAKEGDGLELIKQAMDNMSAAMMYSAYEIAKGKDDLPDCNIVGLLDELGLDDDLHEDACIFLVDNPKKLKAILRYPQERRRSLLIKMMSAALPP